MILGKVKLTVSIEMAFPLGNITKEAAEKEISDQGGKDAFSAAMVDQLRQNMGNQGRVEMLDCDLTVAEI